MHQLTALHTKPPLFVNHEKWLVKRDKFTRSGKDHWFLRQGSALAEFAGKCEMAHGIGGDVVSFLIVIEHDIIKYAFFVGQLCHSKNVLLSISLLQAGS